MKYSNVPLTNTESILNYYSEIKSIQRRGTKKRPYFLNVMLFSITITVEKKTEIRINIYS